MKSQTKDYERCVKAASDFSVFRRDCIADFERIERKLVSLGYLDSKLVWSKDKQELGVFVEKLLRNNYFQKMGSETARRPKVRAYFERLYGVSFEQQFRKSRLNEIDIDSHFITLGIKDQNTFDKDKYSIKY